jgi:hypothetical protein
MSLPIASSPLRPPSIDSLPVKEAPWSKKQKKVASFWANFAKRYPQSQPYSQAASDKENVDPRACKLADVGTSATGRAQPSRIGASVQERFGYEGSWVNKDGHLRGSLGKKPGNAEQVGGDQTAAFSQPCPSPRPHPSPPPEPAATPPVSEAPRTHLRGERAIFDLQVLENNLRSSSACLECGSNDRRFAQWNNGSIRDEQQGLAHRY